eukprot:c695_g1_i1.p1 GENE.c695_g1_i1~~c695_g1_i1.p1  ORF type:complete len:442 (-),score=105.70 c695_g1_i1:77-1348(-)
MSCVCSFSRQLIDHAINSEHWSPESVADLLNALHSLGKSLTCTCGNNDSKLNVLSLLASTQAANFLSQPPFHEPLQKWLTEQDWMGLLKARDYGTQNSRQALTRNFVEMRAVLDSLSPKLVKQLCAEWPVEDTFNLVSRLVEDRINTIKKASKFIKKVSKKLCWDVSTKAELLKYIGERDIFQELEGKLATLFEILPEMEGLVSINQLRGYARDSDHSDTDEDNVVVGMGKKDKWDNESDSDLSFISDTIYYQDGRVEKPRTDLSDSDDDNDNVKTVAKPKKLFKRRNVLDDDDDDDVDIVDNHDHKNKDQKSTKSNKDKHSRKGSHLDDSNTDSDDATHHKKSKPEQANSSNNIQHTETHTQQKHSQDTPTTSLSTTNTFVERSIRIPLCKLLSKQHRRLRRPCFRLLLSRKQQTNRDFVII